MVYLGVSPHLFNVLMYYQDLYVTCHVCFCIDEDKPLVSCYELVELTRFRLIKNIIKNIPFFNTSIYLIICRYISCEIV